jgi:hypothetical protein
MTHIRRTSLPSRIAVFAAVGIAVLAGSLVIKPSSSSADSASSPEPSASAASSGAADAGPPLPKFDAEPFSDEKTASPTAADWKPTLPVALSDPLPFGCKAYRVREWVKIRCSQLATAEVAMLSGDRDGVMLFIDPPRGEGFTVSPGGEIVFPVRRGDRRVFEWSTFGESYEGPGFPELAFVISQSWTPDEPSPRIIFR